MLECWNTGVMEYWSIGVLGYWSFGVMGENRVEESVPFFRAYRNMDICSIKVIKQQLTQVGASKSL